MNNDLFYKYLTGRNIIVLIAMILLVIFISKNIDIAILIFASLVIACSLDPLVSKLEKKIKRGPAAVIVLGLFLLGLAIPISTMLFLSAEHIYSGSSAFINNINHLDVYIKKNSLLKTLLSQVDINSYIQYISAHATEISEKTFHFFQSIGTALLYLLIFIIITFLFMTDRDTINTNFLRLFPPEAREKGREITNSIEKKIGGYVVAQAMAIFSVGIVMTVGLLIFGIFNHQLLEYALTLGILTAILDLIPVIGPGIALIISIITVLGLQNAFVAIIGVIVSFTAAQLIENNLVRPVAFSKFLNLHPLLIFIFLFIGAKYFGLIGALFAPAIAATVCVLIEELYIKSIE